MSRDIKISQSIDPNTIIFEIHEQYRTRLSLLISRAEAIKLCDNMRSLLDEPPIVPIAGPKLAVFPEPKSMPMKLGINNK